MAMSKTSLQRWMYMFPLALVMVILLFKGEIVMASGEPASPVIAVEIFDWGLDLSESAPAPGITVLRVTNVGTRPLGFAFHGPQTQLAFADALAVGETKTMLVDLQPGRYVMFDPLEDHAERGVSLKFSVTGQSQAEPVTPTVGPSRQTTPQATNEQGTPEPTGESSGQGQPSPEGGQQVFADNCAGCHGENGQGQVGPALSGNEFVTQQDPAAVIDTVLHGRGQMPAFQDQLSDDQVAAVLTFIRNSWGNDAESVSPEQISQGSDGQSAADDQQDQDGETQATPAGPQVTINLVARNRSFDLETITVPAGARVTVQFANQDAYPHNFAVYETSAANQAIYSGGVISGPDQTVTYQFTAPSQPGEYFFRCDVHPYMNGSFIVEGR